MIRIGHLLLALALALFATAGTAQSAAEAPPPAELFYRPPDIARAVLSPSGRWLALKTGLAGVRDGLVVFDLKAWKPLTKAVRFDDVDINDFQWVNDDRLVFDLIDRTRGSGDQRWWPGLFSVKRDGTELRELVQLEHHVISDGSARREPLSPWHRLLHVPAGGGDEVLVGESIHTASGEFVGLVAKRLNVVTGRAVSVSAGVPSNVYKWMFDATGEPRLVMTRRKGRSAAYWRAPGQTEWRRLFEADTYALPWTPEFIDGEGALFVSVAEGKGGTDVLKRYDFSKDAPAAEPLVSTPGFDFDGRIVSETQGSRALGVRVTTDAETTVWFDKRLAALQQEADRRLPGRVNRLTCRRCDEPDMTVVVRSWSAQEPGQFVVHNVATGEWRGVGSSRSGINARRMGTTDFERIKARDGLEIPLWITQPAGPAQGPRPAVMLVHGGPWVRGRKWEWEADAQFLASRGYVVLEPEFRGSTGYGQKLYRAGWKQWGRAMQDDLADALAWAVGKGLVDPKKVCIAGASYGGYATLMGLVRHPDLYRCGVAWVAVTDPRLMLEWRAGTDQGDELREVDYPKLIGDPKEDAAMLDSVTPVLRAREIKAPVMLAFGLSDRRVLPVHGTRMRKALEEAGNPPEWVEYADEGHGWLKLSNRVDFANKLEAFLARHLK